MTFAGHAGAELVAEVTVKKESSEAMRDRPVHGREGVLAGGAGAPARQFGDEFLQHAKGLGCLGVDVGIAFEVGEFGPEHETKIHGLVEGEGDVGAPDLFELLRDRARAGRGLFEAVGQELEAAGNESGDDGSFVFEVMIGGLVAHAGAAGDFAHGQAGEAGLGDQLFTRIEDAHLQIQGHTI